MSFEVNCSADSSHVVSVASSPRQDTVQIGVVFPDMPMEIAGEKFPSAGLYVHLDPDAIRDLIDHLAPFAAEANVPPVGEVDEDGEWQAVDPNEPKVLFRGAAVAGPIPPSAPISELCGTKGSSFECPAGCCSFGEVKTKPVIKRPECCRLEAEETIAKRAAWEFLAELDEQREIRKDRCAPDDGQPCCGEPENDGTPAIGTVTLEAEKPAETTLGEADRIINGPRAQYYGDARTNHQRIANLWNAFLESRPDVDRPLGAHEVALMMVFMKVARLIESPAHHDSYVDMAGYTAITEKIVLADKADLDWAHGVLGTQEWAPSS